MLIHQTLLRLTVKLARKRQKKKILSTLSEGKNEKFYSLASQPYSTKISAFKRKYQASTNWINFFPSCSMIDKPTAAIPHKFQQRCDSAMTMMPQPRCCLNMKPHNSVLQEIHRKSESPESHVVIIIMSSSSSQLYIFVR